MNAWLAARAESLCGGRPIVPGLGLRKVRLIGRRIIAKISSHDCAALEIICQEPKGLDVYI